MPIGASTNSKNYQYYSLNLHTDSFGGWTISLKKLIYSIYNGVWCMLMSSREYPMMSPEIKHEPESVTMVVCTLHWYFYQFLTILQPDYASEAELSIDLATLDRFFMVQVGQFWSQSSVMFFFWTVSYVLVVMCSACIFGSNFKYIKSVNNDNMSLLLFPL